MNIDPKDNCTACIEFRISPEEKIQELMKINSDLSRLGNLIKYWLANDPKLQVATKLKIENKLPEILNIIQEQKLNIGDLASDIRKNLTNNRKRW